MKTLRTGAIDLTGDSPPLSSDTGVIDLTNDIISSSKKKNRSGGPPVPKFNSVVPISHSTLHVNIDASDKSNPQEVCEYVNEIYTRFRETEGEHGPTVGILVYQYDINEKMRSILFDWLVEVHMKFRLKTETLYLTVNLIDRYLGVVHDVPRSKLQLVGVACLLLASKYEEIYPPDLYDCAKITAGAYTQHHIVSMERDVLRALEYRLTVPTHYKFLVRYIKASQCDTRTRLVAYYFCEICLPEYDMLEFKPSLIASAAVLLALKATDPLLLADPTRTTLWTETLEFYTKYTLDEVTPCAQRIINIVQKAETSSLQAIRKKYAVEKFGYPVAAALRVKYL